MKYLFSFTLTLVTCFSGLCQSDAIDALIASKMKTKKIPGLQLVITKNNKIIKNASYGIANIEDEVPVDATTTFAINSMTKAFTGVAVMQLVEEGKITLEDPISNYLENIPETWKNITIQQVLTHTSGLPNMMDYNAKVIASWEEAQKLPMVFEPNTNFQYNQTNYVIIGKIINKVSGSTFQDFIRERQLKLIDADRTIESGFGHYQSVIPHSARGYTYFINGNLTHAYEEFPEIFRTAAGMSSTATELANWHIALQNGTFFKNPKSLSTLWSPLRKKYPNGAIISLSEILKNTVAWSDNLGCDLLFEIIGGPNALQSYLKKIGIADIAIVHTEMEMQAKWERQFENWTTAKAANKVLHLFYENPEKMLSAKSRDFLLHVLVGTKTGKKSIRGLLSKETVVAHKTGHSGKNKKGVTGAVNDIGIVFLPDNSYFYLSILVSDSLESDQTNQRMIAEIAKLSWDYFKN